MTRKATIPLLPRRKADTHKGSYGRILVIAGSRNMPGAAALTALGALRGGAGLVTVATPASALGSIAPTVPCATYVSLPESKSGALGAAARAILLERAESADVVVLGPGLGQEPATVRLIRTLIEQLDRRLVLDADGLNAIAGEPQRLAHRSRATILTPHPGELCRLDGGPSPGGAKKRKSRAEALAAAARSVVCLKGHQTVVTDAHRTYINDTGNPGMASGGSGDVLSGLTGALVAQLASPLDATILAVRVHGIAGDRAAKKHGTISLIATDLIDHLGPAFLKVQSRS